MEDAEAAAAHSTSTSSCSCSQNLEAGTQYLALLKNEFESLSVKLNYSNFFFFFLRGIIIKNSYLVK